MDALSSLIPGMRRVSDTLYASDSIARIKIAAKQELLLSDQRVDQDMARLMNEWLGQQIENQELVLTQLKEAKNLIKSCLPKD